MSNDNSIQTIDSITYYTNTALSILNIYDPKKEGEFCDWLNKFEFAADIISVPNDKMIEFFQNMVDNDVHINVKKTFSSDNFSELEYQQMINNYLQYFATSNEIDLHKTRLSCRIQYEEETIEKYAASLRKIFHNCCSTSSSEKELCIQFVKGIRDNSIRTHLIEMPNLSFDEMVIKAIEFEDNNQMNDYVNEALTMINIYTLKYNDIFYEWLNKLEYVADYIKVPSMKMTKFFIMMIHKDIHNNINEIFQLFPLLTFSYEETVKYYAQYFGYENETMFNCLRFKCRDQYETETLTKYADNLQQLYFNCILSKISEQHLLDQFASGVRNEELKNYLSNTSFSSFSQQFDKAIAFEKAYEMTHYKNEALKIINIFNPTKEVLFHEWLNKFEHATNIIGVSNERMIEFFNEMIENDVRMAVMQTFPVINFSELSYERIIDYYFIYFSASSDDNLYDKRFTCRKQYEAETIKNYALHLQKLYNELNNSNCKEEQVLCEQFINGIYNNDVKTNLIETPCLSFDELVAKAIEFENDYQIINYYFNQALTITDIYTASMKGLFQEWLNNFEFVVDIIGVPDDKIIKIFNKMIDNNVHSEIKMNNPFINFSVISYDELINYYLRYFYPTCENDIHRKRFLLRKQFKKETIQKYADNLLKIYKKVNNSDNSEKILCKQFLKGINDKFVKSQLRKISFKSFNEMVLSAISHDNDYLISRYLNPILLMIDTYNSSTDNSFHLWLNKFEFVASYVGVPCHKMLIVFNKMIDDDVHERFKQCYPTVNLSILTYSGTISYYLRFFNPDFNPGMDLHIKRFMCRKQYRRETINMYAKNLYEIYEMCSSIQFQDKKLCRQFIEGIRDNQIKNYLRKLPLVSFRQAVQTANLFT